MPWRFADRRAPPICLDSSPTSSLPRESSSAIATARGSPFRIAIYLRLNSAKCLFTIFKTMGESIMTG